MQRSLDYDRSDYYKYHAKKRSMSSAAVQNRHQDDRKADYAATPIPERSSTPRNTTAPREVKPVSQLGQSYISYLQRYKGER